MLDDGTVDYFLGQKDIPTKPTIIDFSLSIFFHNRDGGNHQWFNSRAHLAYLIYSSALTNFIYLVGCFSLVHYRLPKFLGLCIYGVCFFWGLRKSKCSLLLNRIFSWKGNEPLKWCVKGAKFKGFEQQIGGRLRKLSTEDIIQGLTGM